MKKWILALVIFLMVGGFALAQDATESAPVNAPVATGEAPAPANEGQSSADPAITLKWWQVLSGLAMAVAGGGAIGIIGFAVIATRLRNDKVTMQAIEGLANSVPADVAKLMLNLSRSTEAVAGLVEEAFDGIPAASKVTIEANPAPAG